MSDVSERKPVKAWFWKTFISRGPRWKKQAPKGERESKPKSEAQIILNLISLLQKRLISSCCFRLDSILFCSLPLFRKGMSNVARALFSLFGSEPQPTRIRITISTFPFRKRYFVFFFFFCRKHRQGPLWHSNEARRGASQVKSSVVWNPDRGNKDKGRPWRRRNSWLHSRSPSHTLR